MDGSLILIVVPSTVRYSDEVSMGLPLSVSLKRPILSKFSKEKPSGLITKYGGVASHMAIRCAELGLPAAIGCGEIWYNKLKNSHKINLNCKDKDILIIEYKDKKDFSEERKILKSLGYIR